MPETIYGSMSDTLTAYTISVAILAALALLIPCIDALARLFLSSNLDAEEAQPNQPQPTPSPRKAA